MKIKNGDRVIVIAGKDKNKTGVVISTFPKKNQVVVEGVGIRTYHKKPSQINPEGGLIKQEGPIDVSNVMFIQGKKDKFTASKIGYRQETNTKGKKEKVRFFKKTGEKI